MANALNVKIGADISELQSAMKSASKSIRDAGKRMQDVGRTMSMRVTAPLAAIGAGAVKMAGDFEDSFANIRKTVDATEPEFNAMQDQLRELAKEVPTSVNELNKIGGIAGQLGIANDSIVDFTKTIAMLGDATDIAGEEAALSITRFMNVMGTAQSDIDRMGATIVGLGNNFAAMESEIVHIGTSLAAFGKDLGLSETEVLSFATAIAASGGEAQAASTAFQKTGAEMKKAVLTGNSNLNLFAKTAGVTADQFKKSFQQDASGAIVSFLEGLNRIQKNGQSTTVVLEELGLADQRLQREFGKVTGNIKDLNRAFDISNESWKENTALTDEAQKRYDTFNSRIKIAWNNIKDLGITIGNDLMPSINKLIISIRSGVDWFSELSPAMRKVGIATLAVAAALGPTIFALGALARALGGIMIVLPKVVAGIKLLTAAMMANPYLAVGAAILAIGVAIYKIMPRAKGLRDEIEKIDDLAPDMKEDALTQAIAKVSNRIKALKDEFGDVPIGEVKLLQKELDKLIQKRDRLAASKIKVADPKETNETASAIDNVAQSIDRVRIAASKPINAIFDPADAVTVRLMRDEFALFQDALYQASTFTMDFSHRFSTAMDESKEKAMQLGQALQSQVTGAIQSFATTIGDSFTGDAGASGFFNNILMIVADFGENLGKSLVAAGVAAQAFKMLLANPYAAIAAGGALIAASRVVKNLLQEGPSTSVNDALITSKGDIVKFNSADDILASKNMDKVIGGGGGGTQRVEVFGTLKGQDLFISSDRGGDTYGR